MPDSFHLYTKDGKIILEPVMEVPAHEAWLYEPENRKILEAIKKGIKQGGSVYKGSFAKYLKD